MLWEMVPVFLTKWKNGWKKKMIFLVLQHQFWSFFLTAVSPTELYGAMLNRCVTLLNRLRAFRTKSLLQTDSFF